MKYLKLFEDHKETSDKISEIERLAKEQSDEVINQYKELIDEVMYDVSDDYKTESKINVNYDSISDCKTYLDYRIYFTGDKYEDLLSKLLEVVRRLKDAYDVSYDIKGIFDMDVTTLPRYTFKKLPGRINYYTNPFDFVEAKKIVKNHIDINSRTNPSDIKLMILISF
jgi:uncharacterized protein YaaR (DUF327 family)